MPFIHVRYSTPTEQDLRQPIAAFVTETTARVLQKKADVTAVVVEQVRPTDWFIGSRALTDHRKATFFVEVRVTRGTNVKEEKAAYLREVFRGLETLLGPVHPESYVHVHETTGDAYGYGGLSQDARWHRANT
ncbi:MAG TPA: 4-oxalocrotonate tautomerase family protein [Myxococcaceae bacterium]|nr:4-oxalocrotonate tautomerase family protein [Myxococcaceae bacterium]